MGGVLRVAFGRRKGGVKRPHKGTAHRRYCGQRGFLKDAIGPVSNAKKGFIPRFLHLDEKTKVRGFSGGPVSRGWHCGALNLS